MIKKLNLHLDSTRSFLMGVEKDFFTLDTNELVVFDLLTLDMAHKCIYLKA